jgi:acetyl coenzyme A synthetase (ADP forming)-like protein
MSRFLDALSAESRYLRFHGFAGLDEELLSSFVDPDWVERGALVAALSDADDEERIVALASYARLRDVGAAEVALAVADGQHGRGIGTRLLEQLARRARGSGISSFVASVLSGNAAALALFAEAGFELERTGRDGEVELRFPIAPTPAFAARVEARDHNAVAASLRPFFTPTTIAVVGASRRRGTIGGELFRNILEADFAGAVYPVNLKAEPVAGVRAWPSIEAIPDEIELAVICVPGGQVLDAAQAALRRGVRSLCVISAGFAESGAEGRARQDALVAAVRSHGARLVGPNCLGIASSAVQLNATFAPRALPPGRIGFSSQSGALGLALLEKAGARGLGFSSFVSIGNKADVSSNDLLEWWEDDPDTDLVLLYLESFGNPRRFAEIARRLARRKPILALKAGATGAGARAAGSHTAALAGSDAAADALFAQAGVLRARTLEELIDTAVVLGSQPLPRGRQAAVITNAGGLGILCADACSAAGLSLPELSDETRRALADVLPSEASTANPVDLLGSATAETYRAAIPVVLADPGVDALIVLFVPPVVAGAEEVAAATVAAVEESDRTKPVLAVVMSADGTPAALLGGDSPVAALEYPESAAHALAALANRAEWLRRPAGVVTPVADVDRSRARGIVDGALEAGGEGWLEPGPARDLLDAYRIPVVPQSVVDDEQQAADAAAELGYPVVVKSAAAGAHKTERGGVAVDLRDDDAVRAAFRRIGPPVVVQRFVHGGVELLAGAVQDPVFGPLVAFGPGGVLAELIGDASFRIAPLSDLDARELVTGGKAGRLVAGFRGAPPADARALEELVHRLAWLAEQNPEIAELDLNPVIASSDGCVAVDARIRVATPTREPHLKSW